MGTRIDKLNKLLDTKQNIKAALIEQGQSVSDTDPFASYAEKILAISGCATTTVEEWVPFCTDGTTWMGEVLYGANEGSYFQFGYEYKANVNLSGYNQYRITLNGVEYRCSRSDDGVKIWSSVCPVWVEFVPIFSSKLSMMEVRCSTSDAGSFDSRTAPDGTSRYAFEFKIEALSAPDTISESYTGEWVPFSSDGTWMGEVVTPVDTYGDVSDIDWSGTADIGDGAIHRITLDGQVYIMNGASVSLIDIQYNIAAENCPIHISTADTGGTITGKRKWSVGGFPDIYAHTIKIESLVASV